MSIVQIRAGLLAVWWRCASPSPACCHSVADESMLPAWQLAEYPWFPWLPPRSFCFEHAVYQPTNVQKLFAAALDDGRSMLEASDLAHWVEAAVSAGGIGRTMALASC